MAKILKDYNVQAKLDILVAITVKAESLDKALEKAKLLETKDFVTIHGDWIDGGHTLTGIYE